MITSAEVASSPGIDRLTAGCMAAVIKKMELEAPGGAGSTMTLPLTLSLAKPP